MRSAVAIFLLAVLAAASGCGDAERLSALEREKESLEKKVESLEAKLEEAHKAIVAAPAPAAPTDQASKEGPAADELAACRAKLERCEKDPFTGTKYLAEPGGDSKASQSPQTP